MAATFHNRQMLAGHATDASLMDDAPSHAARPQTGPHVVCFPFAGGIAGGSHVSACKLIQSLDRTQFTPLVVLHSDKGEVAELFRREGVPFTLAPSPHHFGRSPGVERPRGLVGFAKALAAQTGLTAFLRKHRVSIVHTNEGPMHLSWSVPAKLSGAKLVWHHRSNPDARSLRFLAPVLADQLVSVSRFALSQANAVRDRASTSVIYSPFDVDKLVADKADARRKLIEELGVSPETRLLGFFGNFVPRKRPFLFVDVVAELRRIAPDLPVMGLMFGSAFDPEVERELAARASDRGIARRFKLMGFRYPPEQWLAACDLHLVTSVEEPFGRSLIEAMLLGTPVVAVASGGNIEAIEDGETGRLTPPEDAAAMARAVLELLHRPDEMQRIAQAARAGALARFGREKHCEAVTAVYHRALGSRGA